MKKIATKYTTQTFTESGFFLVNNGEPCFIFGVHVAELGGGSDISVSLTTSDEGVTYLDNLLGAREQFVSDIPFVADRGLKINVINNVASLLSITIFHSHSGC